MLATKKFIDYQEASPAENARMLSEGEVDVALVPVTEFAIHGGYVGLDFGIAGRSKIDAVFLLGQQPIDQMKTICLDAGSNSSVSLLRLLFLERRQVQPQFLRVRQDSLVDQVSPTVGALVTGDAALNARGKHALELDLAKEWFNLTGMPFVFCVWAARHEALSRDVDKALNKVFHKAIKARESLAVKHNKEVDLSLRDASNHITQTVIYHLDAECLYGMGEFFKRAFARNLLPDEQYRTARYTALKGGSAPLPRPKEVSQILHDAISGKRLSIAEAMRLAENAGLADLSLAADVLRARLFEQRSVEFVLDVTEPELDEDFLTRLKTNNNKRHRPKLIRLETAPLDSWPDLERIENLIHRTRGATQALIEAVTVESLLSLSRVTGRPMREIMSRLVAAGLDYLPWTGGGLLVDKIRRRRGQGEYLASEWLSAFKWFHRFGGQSSCALEISKSESWEERFLHLQKLRTLQDETPGFRTFAITTFDDEAGIDVDTALRAQMIARLYLDNIPHVISVGMDPKLIDGALSISCGADTMSVDLNNEAASDAVTTSDYLESLRIVGMDIEAVIVGERPKPILH